MPTICTSARRKPAVSATIKTAGPSGFRCNSPNCAPMSHGAGLLEQFLNQELCLRLEPVRADDVRRYVENFIGGGGATRSCEY